MTATLTNTNTNNSFDQLLAESTQNRAQLRTATDNLMNGFPNTARGRRMKERAELLVEVSRHRVAVDEILDRYSVAMAALYASFANEH